MNAARGGRRSSCRTVATSVPALPVVIHQSTEAGGAKRLREYRPVPGGCIPEPFSGHDGFVRVLCASRRNGRRSIRARSSRRAASLPNGCEACLCPVTRPAEPPLEAPRRWPVLKRFTGTNRITDLNDCRAVPVSAGGRGICRLVRRSRSRQSGDRVTIHSVRRRWVSNRCCVPVRLQLARRVRRSQHRQWEFRGGRLSLGRSLQEHPGSNTMLSGGEVEAMRIGPSSGVEKSAGGSRNRYRRPGISSDGPGLCRR